ncbi:alkaline serine protease Alp1 [Myriangium duriaei CBS 260.36]|uniref:Alkaline serine protease Alp1 n=1 Tax=Myriangium duriaei CBS 260.36 TaxID=1168546 RepID=A0A9P4MIW4_9PEZI|nr:alkaline serine protease Alp1 [Myriangium duriaei CBS 260.36]
MLPGSTFVLAGLLFDVATAAIIPQSLDGSLDLSDRYIISLKPNTDLEKHIILVQELHSRSNIQGNATAFAGVTQQYNIGKYRGYAGHFSVALVAQLKLHQDVDIVEDDQTLPPQSDDRLVRQANAPYNLHRISHRGLNDQNNYWYVRQAGEGSFIYFLDSGVDSRHAEFQSRLSTEGFNALDNGRWPPPGTSPDFPPGAHIDNDGHGTFIAGILGGRTYGVSKRSVLVPVKVFNTRTSTSVSNFLQGYDWAVQDIVKRNRVQYSVINVSQSGSYIKSVNDAIDAAFAQGVTTVVPAGNQYKDVKSVSPGSSVRAITVGATNGDRVRLYSSNFGPKVNIFAPGSRICSAWIGGNHRRIRRITGTAEAGAHVAGIVAYLKSFNHLRTAETTWEFMQTIGTRGVVRSAKRSNDLFAYNFSGK